MPHKKIHLVRSYCFHIETFTNKLGLLPKQDTLRLAEEIIQVCLTSSVLEDFVSCCKDKQHKNWVWYLNFEDLYILTARWSGMSFSWRILIYRLMDLVFYEGTLPGFNIGIQWSSLLASMSIWFVYLKKNVQLLVFTVICSHLAYNISRKNILYFRRIFCTCMILGFLCDVH